jgi:hypothetical protein
LTQTQQHSALYVARQAGRAPDLEAGWDDSVWSAAPIATINSFRPESSSHRPETFARLMHDDVHIHGIFRVRDQFVRSVRREYFDEVRKDSCVEFFIQPRAGGGYFNLEMNAGGAHLCSFIEDPTRVQGGFKKFTRLPPEIGRSICVRSSLPKVVDPEIAERIDWEIKFAIPFVLFEHYVGKLDEVIGQTWRGNFFKCAQEVSQPHWASWCPVDEFNFHLPRCFGFIRFE